ncbi:MAG: YitT family protein [Mangrovibacterium sp.]
MAFLSREKLFTLNWFREYSYIIIGAFILAVGFVFFISPHRIVPGGVYGIAIVVHYLTPDIFPFWPDGIPIGLFGLILNIPLTYAGIKILGPKFGVKTITGFVFSSVFIDLITYLRAEGDAPLVSDVLLSCIFGGVLVGFALGLIFKSRATSGGSDIIAMIIAKYSGLQLGQLMIYVDSAIVLLGLAAFGDWQIPFYSWLVIYITGKAIDMTMEGSGYHKALLIISDKHEAIREKILIDLERGGTYLKGNGLYTHEEKHIIYTVVSRREIAILERFISEIDPDAFITIMETREILGEGFQSLKMKTSG